MPHTELAPSFREIVARFERGDGVWEQLPAGGVVSIDRGLPYLLVHRQRPGEDAAAARLVAGEASYLLAAPGEAEDVAPLVAAIAEAGSAMFGAFLVMEIWSEVATSPAFIVRGPAGPAPETLNALVHGLREMRDVRPEMEIDVRVEIGEERQPPGLPPLLSTRDSWKSGVLLLGLEVPPLYRGDNAGSLLPRFFRRFQHRLSQVLRQSMYEFIRVQTNCTVKSYRALGTRTVPDSIWESDRELAAIERSFQFLLLVSPVNEGRAWREFRESGFETEPAFHYRLLPVDPDLLKRRLFAIRMEEIDDPALASLFQDKRRELDILIGMLDERGSPDFLHSSKRLYGTVDDRLLDVAQGLLAALPATPAAASREPDAWVDAEAFRDAAASEVAWYARRHPGIESREIQIRPDLVGLMVSEGNLMIGEALKIRSGRLSPLIHHEVGTHVLTYVNGAAQPMEQLSLGLAGYDELQEGLAVLAEYLVGGLDRSRMRLLGARVIAAHSVEEGAAFVETFHMLRDELGFGPRSAWQVSTRVHQCGGFTRDLIYLRGLMGLLDHLRAGAELEPLYVGKISLAHLPIIEELRHRGVLRAPPLTPRFLEDPAALRRLDAVRRGLTLTEMTCP